HRKREQKIVAAALPGMVRQRAVAPVEVDRLASLTGRRAWRAETRRSAGRDAARAIGGYQAAVSELAFLRHAIRLGTAGPDAADQERRLLAILITSRAIAVERAGLPPIAFADPHR
ncbi:MAG: PrsW family intramembrane metalloprotease, partial [Labedaea sp.]